MHEYLVDGIGSSGVMTDEAEWLAGLYRRRELTTDLGVLPPLKLPRRVSFKSVPSGLLA
jgi:hypothetical protein